MLPMVSMVSMVSMARGVATVAEIEAAMLHLVAQRGEHSSACPSEVARVLSPDGWRELMPRVHEVAMQLHLQRRLDIAQGGVSVSNLDTLRGPIRIRLPHDDVC